jgi:hypothetical protein
VTLVEDEVEIPTEYRLYQNFPNPFNPETTIEYDIPHQAKVEISIYNIIGEKIRTLVIQDHQPGHYSVIWNGRNENNNMVATGVYLYVIKTPEFRHVEKCLFIK